MLPELVFKYQGVDGLKTGTTDFAGYCFTGTASRDGNRYITVVMNAKGEGGEGTYKSRFDETKKCWTMHLVIFQQKKFYLRIIK